MINATSPLWGSGPAAATTATKDRTEMGKDQFLQLLVTQLRHQDPLSPLKPEEFAAQLAQFSSVEQLSQINEGMSNSIAASQLASLIGKTALSASLLGKHVVAEGDQVTIPATGGGQVRIDVAASGDGVFQLLDDSGKVIAERSLGTLAAGRQNVTLPPDLPAGTYHYAVKVTDSSSKAVDVLTYTAGLVDGVFFRDGVIVLKMGTMEVPLDALAEIEPGTPAPAPAGANQ
ncbi:MAG: flagellar hook assembly protein FlgD [Gemmatimonadota bacterium]